MSIRPMLFVAMPFGIKRDPAGTHDIDFDLVYELAIKPAALAAGLEIMRSDEETRGGIIHRPMFERLLLSEVVVADLTTANPNVFYELGVRHCARPRSTIPIFFAESQLPFDAHMLQAIPYTLENGVLTDEAADSLRSKLEIRLNASKVDLELADSPLFQLISEFPGISLPHEVTESFRDRSMYVNEKRAQLEKARRLTDLAKGTQQIKLIENSLGDFSQTSSELLLDVLLSYRDVEAWGHIVSLVDRLPESRVRETITVREQYGLALNRRNEPGDRALAVEVLLGVVDSHGPSPETCGLLGRVYKDWYQETLSNANADRAAAYLDEAIHWYRIGFKADPRDYYPGINLVTLLFTRGNSESISELQELTPVISFAVARRGGIQSNDYWDVATVVEASVLSEDWDLAFQAARRLLIMDAPVWNMRTTVRNLNIIRHIRESRGIGIEEIDRCISLLTVE